MIVKLEGFLLLLLRARAHARQTSLPLTDFLSSMDSEIVSDEFILQSNLTHIHPAQTNNGTTSPALSSTSDNDAFNTESARLHFGPVTSPERRLVAQQVSLFPPLQTTPLRRSPRLSSPRQPSINPQDAYSTEDSDDLERVEEQLVNESDDEGVSGDSGPGTPRPETPLPDGAFPCLPPPRSLHLALQNRHLPWLTE